LYRAGVPPAAKPVARLLPIARACRHQCWLPIPERSGKKRFLERHSSVDGSFSGKIEFAHPIHRAVKTTLMNIVKALLIQ